MGSNEGHSSLSQLASDIAKVVPTVDAETEGQYGDGLGSESEERQVKLILDVLRDVSKLYLNADREVAYPSQTAMISFLKTASLSKRSYSGTGEPTETLNPAGTSMSSVRSTAIRC